MAHQRRGGAPRNTPASVSDAKEQRAWQPVAEDLGCSATIHRWDKEYRIICAAEGGHLKHRRALLTRRAPLASSALWRRWHSLPALLMARRRLRSAEAQEPGYKNTVCV